jgi:hypothetical protein
MPNKIDLSGQRFGRLLVVYPLPPKKKGGSTRWLCRCDCGNESTPGTAQLRRGRANSCGCLQKERVRIANTTHGKTNSPEYRAWIAMWSRCTVKSNASFINYGQRGISVCDRWKDFSMFLTDMGTKPTGMTIERNDNNGNYEPGNCRWATREDQDSNKRTTVLVTFNGKTMTYSQWARELDANPATIRERWLKFGTLNPIQRTKESYHAKANRSA